MLPRRGSWSIRADHRGHRPPPSDFIGLSSVLALLTVAWSVSTVGLVRATTEVAGDLQQAAASDTPTTWYFAEGYTGTGFDEYLTF